MGNPLDKLHARLAEQIGKLQFNVTQLELELEIVTAARQAEEVSRLNLESQYLALQEERNRIGQELAQLQLELRPPSPTPLRKTRATAKR
jgi:chromosome segregation ATPase